MKGDSHHGCRAVGTPYRTKPEHWNENTHRRSLQRVLIGGFQVDTNTPHRESSCLFIVLPMHRSSVRSWLSLVAACAPYCTDSVPLGPLVGCNAVPNTGLIRYSVYSTPTPGTNSVQSKR